MHLRFPSTGRYTNTAVTVNSSSCNAVCTSWLTCCPFSRVVHCCFSEYPEEQVKFACPIRQPRCLITVPSSAVHSDVWYNHTARLHSSGVGAEAINCAPSWFFLWGGAWGWKVDCYAIEKLLTKQDSNQNIAKVTHILLRIARPRRIIKQSLVCHAQFFRFFIKVFLVELFCAPRQ